MSMVAVSMMVNLAAEAEVHNELPMPAIMFGLIAAALFATLGFVMFSYRDVARRQRSRLNTVQADGAAAHGHESTSAGH